MLPYIGEFLFLSVGESKLLFRHYKGPLSSSEIAHCDLSGKNRDKWRFFARRENITLVTITGRTDDSGFESYLLRGVKRIFRLYCIRPDFRIWGARECDICLAEQIFYQELIIAMNCMIWNVDNFKLMPSKFSFWQKSHIKSFNTNSVADFMAKCFGLKYALKMVPQVSTETKLRYWKHFITYNW